MSTPPNKSIMRSLGEFFGHIVQGVKADVGSGAEAAQGRTVRHEVEEREGAGPGGERVTLRRTVIEEIEVRPPAPAAEPPPEA